MSRISRTAYTMPGSSGRTAEVDAILAPLRAALIACQTTSVWAKAHTGESPMMTVAAATAAWVPDAHVQSVPQNQPAEYRFTIEAPKTLAPPSPPALPDWVEQHRSAVEDKVRREHEKRTQEERCRREANERARARAGRFAEMAAQLNGVNTATGPMQVVGPIGVYEPATAGGGSRYTVDIWFGKPCGLTALFYAGNPTTNCDWVEFAAVWTDSSGVMHQPYNRVPFSEQVVAEFLLLHTQHTVLAPRAT